MERRKSAFLYRASVIIALTSALLTGWATANRLGAQAKHSFHHLQTAQGLERLHGRGLAEAYCAACHGSDGNSINPEYPKLAGQKASYLRSQLRDFKNGVRKSDLMSGPASMLSNAQILELARFYSRQRVKPDLIKNPELAEKGAQIFTSSIRGTPPCSACHSRRGVSRMGRMPGRRGRMMGHMRMMGNTVPGPNLNGQHAAYIVRQLDAFASGARQGSVMRSVADALTKRDRKAVAEYISGLR